ncbi:MAG: zinc-ribbon domain-containing protein [Candidatus Lokiarchaeota archaeon]|nr:zinc-ribbon domain-containing protein [Candidatus Lokiarchaeota archaeon]
MFFIPFKYPILYFSINYFIVALFFIHTWYYLRKNLSIIIQIIKNIDKKPNKIFLDLDDIIEKKTNREIVHLNRKHKPLCQKCPSCRAEIEPQSKFCTHCGAEFLSPLRKYSYETKELPSINKKKEHYNSLKRKHQKRLLYNINIQNRNSKNKRNKEKLQECIICKRTINIDTEIMRCPECSAIAHRREFLEWIMIKGFCHSCKNIIKYERLYLSL